MNYYKQKGLAISEFLISLPLLLAVFTLITDIGYYLIQQNMLNKQVQNGANFAAINIQDDIFPSEDVIKNIVAHGIPNEDSYISFIGKDNVSVLVDYQMKVIKVTANSTYNSFFSTLSNIEIGNIPLTATTIVAFRN
ncbi:MAG: TadE/TadG family type IV pilus assembly protein [Vibrio sp.]